VNETANHLTSLVFVWTKQRII